MPAKEWRLYQIAGPNEDGTLPPGLNTAAPPGSLRTDETQDGYGFDLTKDGRIAKGTIPSGTTRVAKTVSIGGSTYYWYYRRCWGISTTTVNVGIPNLDDAFLRHGPPLSFLEDAQSVIALVPFGTDQMAVCKTTGTYILSNCSDTRGTNYFGRSDLFQELAVGAATYVTELDGVLYVSNANGLFAYTDGKTKECTRKVRDALTNFSSHAIVTDYAKHRIIGGTTMVYDPLTDKVFRYSTTSFRFTTRTLMRPDNAPFAVDRVLFHVEHNDTTAGFLKYQLKYEDESWQSERTVMLPYGMNQQTVVTEDMVEARSTRRWVMRLTDLDSNKYIRAVWVEATNFEQDDYSS